MGKERKVLNINGLLNATIQWNLQGDPVDFL